MRAKQAKNEQLVNNINDGLIDLTLSRRRLLSYRNQSIDLRCNGRSKSSMDWFLYDNGLRLERVKKRYY